MNVLTIIEELRNQRDAVEASIQALQRLAGTNRPRRGRPPKWIKEAQPATPDVPKRRGRPRKQGQSSELIE
jgi:hypothetical protein